jgi:hypothetical protein
MAVSGEGMDGAPVDRRAWIPTTIGPGMILGALGAAGVIISMFFPWRTGSIYSSDIPIAFLWDDTTASHHPSLLILLIPLAIVLVVGTVVPIGSGVRLFGAVGTLIVVGLFAYQLHRVLDAFPGAKLGDALDTGFYFAAIGGVIALVSGWFLRSGWAVRRSVD